MPTTTETKKPESILPAAKTPVSVDPLRRKILIYGEAKTGKTTLAANLNPDETLFLATEPGTDAVEVYSYPVTSWQEFLTVGAALRAEIAAGTCKFKLIVVDTVDELQRLCREHVIDGLSGGAPGFHHASDYEYGKGWDAISEEFRLRVAKLCNLGVGVLFTSHEKEMQTKDRTGLAVTRVSPDVGQKGSRQWLLGFVDFIFHSEIIQTTEGEQYVLRLKPTDDIQAGGRIPQGVVVPDMIPLDAKALKAVLSAVAK